jgi:hypothetical protein
MGSASVPVLLRDRIWNKAGFALSVLSGHRALTFRRSGDAQESIGEHL